MIKVGSGVDYGGCTQREGAVLKLLLRYYFRRVGVPIPRSFIAFVVRLSGAVKPIKTLK